MRELGFTLQARISDVSFTCPEQKKIQCNIHFSLNLIQRIEQRVRENLEIILKAHLLVRSQGSTGSASLAAAWIHQKRIKASISQEGQPSLTWTRCPKPSAPCPPSHPLWNQLRKYSPTTAQKWGDVEIVSTSLGGLFLELRQLKFNPNAETVILSPRTHRETKKGCGGYRFQGM